MPGSGGGGGGGGNGAPNGPGGHDGGAGGGALRIISPTTISLGASSSIAANGAPGVDSNDSAGAGGGGSGGSIVLVSSQVTIAGGFHLSASGGIAGASSGGSGAGAGGAGGGGLITIYADNFQTLTPSNFVSGVRGPHVEPKDFAKALTVTRSGTGGGSVSSVPAGISCGSDCSESYDNNETVTLTATPDSGSEFTGWTGACTNATGDCVVPMTADQAVVANFAALPPPTTTTTTTTPTTTTTTPPTTQPLALEFSADKRQTAKKLAARATCSRDCTLRIDAKGRAGEKFTAFVVTDLIGGRAQTVRIKLEHSVLKQIEGERGKVKLSATATDALAERSVAGARGKLKPQRQSYALRQWT
jgi:hypothetical protein